MVTSHKQSGFTIIELLVVIVVIAILAAITIVAYRGISQRAIVSSLSSDLDNASKQLKLAQIDSGNYPVANDCSTPPAPNTICLKASPNTTYQYTVNNSTTPPTFCLTATNGSTSYFTTNDATPTAGGCPGHLVGGKITNLALNPQAAVDMNNWSINYGAGGTGTFQQIDVTGSGLPGNILMGVRGKWSTASTAIGYIANGSSSLGSPIVPGLTYTASLYMRYSTSGVPIFCDAVLYDASGGVMLDTPDTNVTEIQSQGVTIWMQCTFSFTAPLGAVRASIRAGRDAAITSGRTLDVTGVMLTNGSTVYTYADGDSPNWVWNGTPNASTSTGPAL